MRGLAQTLIKTFAPTPRDWSRSATDSYDPLAGTDPATPTTAKLRSTPPAPLKSSEWKDATVRMGDMQTVVAALDIESSGFDPFPAGESSVTVDDAGTIYRVVNYRPYSSGDLRAAFQFQLRR
jgi:hypothetical protein